MSSEHRLHENSVVNNTNKSNEENEIIDALMFRARKALNTTRTSTQKLKISPLACQNAAINAKKLREELENEQF